MKINQPLLFSVFLVFSILLITTFVEAGTMRTPANSATIGGATVVLNASGVNLLNCTFYAGSTLTANSSWTLIRATVLNTTGLAGSINTTFDSTIVEDANNYQFNSTCYNNTGLTPQSLTTSIRVDNTVPTAPSSLLPTSDTDNSVAFSATVNNPTTTSCSLRFDGVNPGSPTYTATYSASSCTYTHSNVPEGSYKYYFRASDETNTTDSVTQTVNVDVKTSAGKAALLAQQKGVKLEGGATYSISNLTNGQTTGIVALIALIGIIIFFAIRRR